MGGEFAFLTKSYGACIAVKKQQVKALFFFLPGSFHVFSFCSEYLGRESRGPGHAAAADPGTTL